MAAPGQATNLAHTSAILTCEPVREAAPERAAIAAIRAIVPAAACLMGGGLRAADGDLFPEELRAIENSVEKRRLEFRAGRNYARRALQQFGFGSGPIPVSASRAPVWPVGFVGAIAHTGSLCAVVVARASQFYGIGIDVEDDEPLKPELARYIVATDDELRDRQHFEACANIDLPKLLFVIKEAMYKLYNPLTGNFLDFRDVRAIADPNSKRFTASLIQPDRPAARGRRCFDGGFGRAPGFIFAYVDMVCDGDGPAQP